MNIEFAVTVSISFDIFSYLFLAIFRYFNANQEFAQKWPLSRKRGSENSTSIQGGNRSQPFYFHPLEEDWLLGKDGLTGAGQAAGWSGGTGLLGGKAAQILAPTGPTLLIVSLSFSSICFIFSKSFFCLSAMVRTPRDTGSVCLSAIEGKFTTTANSHHQSDRFGVLCAYVAHYCVVEDIRL